MHSANLSCLCSDLLNLVLVNSHLQTILHRELCCLAKLTFSLVSLTTAVKVWILVLIFQILENLLGSLTAKSRCASLSISWFSFLYIHFLHAGEIRYHWLLVHVAIWVESSYSDWLLFFRYCSVWEHLSVNFVKCLGFFALWSGDSLAVIIFEFSVISMFFIHFVHFCLFQLHFYHLLLFEDVQLIIITVAKRCVSFSWGWELVRVLLTWSVTELITILSPVLCISSFTTIEMDMFLLRLCWRRQFVNSDVANLTFKGKWVGNCNNFLLDPGFINHLYILKWLHQWVSDVEHLMFWSQLLFASKQFGDTFLLFLYSFTSFL